MRRFWAQNNNAQVNLVHLIAIIRTEIDLIHVIKIAITGIAIVEIIEMMTEIIADMTIRGIETGTAVEMTIVVGAIETAGSTKRWLRLQLAQSRQ